MKKRLIIIASALIACAILFAIFSKQVVIAINQIRIASIPLHSLTSDQLQKISIVADTLDTPWSIARLPDGRLLVTERQGTVVLINTDQTRIPINGVVEEEEGGLLGLTVHPDFAKNNYVYVYKSTGPMNVVERYTLKGKTLIARTTIIDNIPAAKNHDGGQIAFGPDMKLYITTGDANVEAHAQDVNSLAGKILRLNDDGSVPSDNPFGNATYSYGHRNPQGLAWDGQGRLWATEHGPSVTHSGWDELNLIQKGGNYGWPVIKGSETHTGMISPIAQSGPHDTWAPSGLTYADGNLYFAGLRGESLYKAHINGSTVTLSRYLTGQYGRLRAVTLSNDGALLVSTSDRDGRGTPKAGDDKIIRVPLTILN